MSAVDNQLPPPEALLAIAMAVLKALKAHNEHITTNAVAVSALVQALAEERAELGDRYEKYRAAMSASAPIVATSRAIGAQIDEWLALLATVKL